MKILVDECVDWRLARQIIGHAVKTARQMGWSAIKNGELLELAAKEFDVFVTVDRNLSFQRHLPTFTIAVIQAEVAHGSDGCFNSARFTAKYGQSPNWGERKGFDYYPTPSLLGLFCHSGVMPDDLRRRFKSIAPKPEPVQLASQDDLPAEWPLEFAEWNAKTRQREIHTRNIPLVERLTDRAATHDLKAVLRLIDAGKLAVSDKTSQPGAAALRAVDGLLLGGDLVDDFFRRMRATGTDFEITRDPWNLYICEPGYGSLGYEGFHAWHILQARYALCLLFEYAATLSLLDVAYIPPRDARPDYTSPKIP